MLDHDKEVDIKQTQKETKKNGGKVICKACFLGKQHNVYATPPTPVPWNLRCLKA